MAKADLRNLKALAGDYPAVLSIWAHVPEELWDKPTCIGVGTYDYSFRLRTITTMIDVAGCSYGSGEIVFRVCFVVHFVNSDLK